MTSRSSESRCVACGRAYAATEWSHLHLIKRLDPGDLASLVSPWPSHLVVEARVCEGCGGEMSRVSRIASAVA